MKMEWEFDLQHWNCWHFCQQFWKELSGNDLGNLAPARMSTLNVEQAVQNSQVGFEKLLAPRDPCIVLAIRPNTMPHVGVYHQGRIVHAKSSGVRNDPISLFKMGFSELHYYVPKDLCKNSG